MARTYSLRSRFAAAFALGFGLERFSFGDLFFEHAAIVRFFCPNRVLNRVQTS